MSEKRKADDHRRLLEEKLLGIRSDQSHLALSMSAMGMVMAGAPELDPALEADKRSRIKRVQSLPLTE